MEYNLPLSEFLRTLMIPSALRFRARRSGLFGASALLLAAMLSLARPAAAQESSAVARAKRPASRATRAKSRADVARFRARVEAALGEAHAQRAYWGVLVVDRDTGETLYELNADHFFRPGSNTKVFTTAFALATLGPDYRFHTTLNSKGSLSENGRLAGDLILVGSGDPDLSNRKFPYAGKVERDGPVEKVLIELADAAVAKGLKEVDGDIVADDSIFPYDPYPAGWSVGDLFFTFGAPASAITFNENSVSIEIRPGEHAGDPSIIVVEPGAAIDSFGYEISTSAASEKPDFSVVRRPGLNFILLRGSIPLGHAPVKLDLAMTDPAETMARSLKQLLEARGVRVTGGIRVQHAPPPLRSVDVPVVLPRGRPEPPSNSYILAEHISPALLECIRLTNKISQNLHAELLLRTVGQVKAGLGTTDAGIWLEQDFLKTAGIREGDAVLVDGSGLSQNNLVTPRAITDLLLYAFRQPWGADFLSTLPIAGVDGTLENRMKGTAAAGQLQAKTGTLEHEHSISGYATTLRGEHIVFAIFGNNNPQRGHDATAPLDEITVAMVETLGTVPAQKKKR
jgi:D-alanyl-D-alanine carboxypeptidase/D-alanyl-D-alanine-endopeptidase (penicillin-binding protein 4)